MHHAFSKYPRCTCPVTLVMCLDLEATHESLIPLEEEGEEEEATSMETDLLDQVVNLARDLGRSHGLRGREHACKEGGW